MVIFSLKTTLVILMKRTQLMNTEYTNSLLQNNLNNLIEPLKISWFISKPAIKLSQFNLVKIIRQDLAKGLLSQKLEHHDTQDQRSHPWAI